MPEDKKEVEVKDPNHCEHLCADCGHNCQDAVVHAQHLLNVEANGMFDRTTIGAVVNFQASHGMVATGEIDSDTLAALHAAHTHCKCE